MTDLLAEIIGILVAGISTLATGIGSGLKSLVESIFVDVGTNGAISLTTFGGLAIVFSGIGLAIGLSRFVLRWVTSLGN